MDCLLSMNAGHYRVCCCHQPLEMEMEFEIRLHMSELLRGYNISASSTVSHVTDIGSSLYLISSHICAFLHLCVFSHATPSFVTRLHHFCMQELNAKLYFQCVLCSLFAFLSPLIVERQIIKLLLLH